jgi:hypothetical protein
LLKLSMAHYYSKFNIWDVYNMIRIPEGNECKMDFRIHYGLVKSLCIPFELNNASVSIQVFIDDTLPLFLGIICTAFLTTSLLTVMIWRNTMNLLEQLWPCSI